MVAIRVAPPPAGDLPLTAYPSASRRPMPETELHGLVTTEGKERLATHYAGRADVYVGGNIMVYYLKNDTRKSISPDIFVALGAPKLPERRSYYTWVDGPITWALEVISETSVKRDTEAKKRIYARIGIPEYFLFDPEGSYVLPRLQGYRLVGRRYRPIRPDAEGWIVSWALGLRFHAQGRYLEIVDIATGLPLLLPKEQERLRADQERTRAEQADARAGQERARADQERARAEALAAEVEALRRRLRELLG